MTRKKPIIVQLQPIPSPREFYGQQTIAFDTRKATLASSVSSEQLFEEYWFRPNQGSQHGSMVSTSHSHHQHDRSISTPRMTSPAIGAVHDVPRQTTHTRAPSDLSVTCESEVNSQSTRPTAATEAGRPAPKSRTPEARRSPTPFGPAFWLGATIPQGPPAHQTKPPPPSNTAQELPEGLDIHDSCSSFLPTTRNGSASSGKVGRASLVETETLAEDEPLVEVANEAGASAHGVAEASSAAGMFKRLLAGATLQHRRIRSWANFGALQASAARPSTPAPNPPQCGDGVPQAQDATESFATPEQNWAESAGERTPRASPGESTKPAAPDTSPDTPPEVPTERTDSANAPQTHLAAMRHRQHMQVSKHVSARLHEAPTGGAAGGLAPKRSTSDRRARWHREEAAGTPFAYVANVAEGAEAAGCVAPRAVGLPGSKQGKLPSSRGAPQGHGSSMADTARWKEAGSKPVESDRGSSEACHSQMTSARGGCVNSRDVLEFDLHTCKQHALCMAMALNHSLNSENQRLRQQLLQQREYDGKPRSRTAWRPRDARDREFERLEQSCKQWEAMALQAVEYAHLCVANRRASYH